MQTVTNSRKKNYRLTSPRDWMPPNDKRMEETVIGCMLASSFCIPEVMSLITDKEVFYHQETEKLFVILQELYHKRQPIDLITLWKKCEENQVNPEILYRLEGKTGSTAWVKNHCLYLLELYTLRKLIFYAEGLKQKCFAKEDFLDTYGWAFQELNQISSTVFKKPAMQIHNIMAKEIEHLESIRSKGITGIASGWSSLDGYTNGFQNSDLIIVAARSSMGKTSFALSLLTRMALQNRKVALFSIEQPVRQILQRIWSTLTEIELKKIRSAYLSPGDFGKIMEASNQLVDKNLFIDDSASVSIVELTAKMHQLKLQHGIEIAFVDYLQLIKPVHKKGANREQEVSEIAKGLKEIARELNIPVVAIAQLSRATEQRSNKKPQLSDLRESGDIENTADLVMFLYRESYYEKVENPDDIQKAEVIIAKHRNGPMGFFEMKFQKELTRFSE